MIMTPLIESLASFATATDPVESNDATSSRTPAVPRARIQARLHLPQAERQIEIPAGQTVLSAALDAGIPFPHGCRSGRCGACRSMLVEGEVSMGTHTSFALSEEDRAAGLILACRATPIGDLTVRWLDESNPGTVSATHEATVVGLHQMTDEIRLIRLRLKDRRAFRFAAGQYLTLMPEGAPARHYSMASRPDEELVDLHVAAVPGGQTSNHLMSSIETGSRVSVRGPAGSAYLRDAHHGPVVAVAGGSGLAPIKSIVETALVTGMAAPIRLYFAARAEKNLYLVEHFAMLMKRFANFSFIPVMSGERGNERRTGRIQDAVAADHGSLIGYKAYVAGSPSLVGAVTPMLVARGAALRDIHADVFFSE